MGGIIAIDDGLLFSRLNGDFAIVMCDDGLAGLAGWAPIRKIISIFGH
jgi:hypothetical protein